MNAQQTIAIMAAILYGKKWQGTEGKDAVALATMMYNASGPETVALPVAPPAIGD